MNNQEAQDWFRWSQTVNTPEEIPIEPFTEIFHTYPRLSIVLVTCHANGAVCFFRHKHSIERIIEPALVPTEPIRDKTGTGDAALAAFLTAYLEQQPSIVCLRRAVVAGALAATKLGGANMPTRQECDNLYSQMYT